MPRREPLPKHELEICGRLAAFRSERNITRAALAKQIGINQFSLANIERGLAPVRFLIAYNFCAAYNRSLRWLATGQLPKSYFTPLSKEITNRFSPKWLFSQAYQEGIEALVNERMRDRAAESGKREEELDSVITIDNSRLGSGSLADEHFERTMDFAKSWAQGMSTEQKISFANQLADVCFRFHNAESTKRDLTINSLKGNSSGVKPEIKRLMARVRKHADIVGREKLAKALKVTPPRISEWLSGKKEPGGEYTLQLLRWVQKLEEK